MGDITVREKENHYSLEIEAKGFKEAGLDAKKLYEIVKAKQGIWVLVEKEKPKENPLDKKIFTLLEGKDLKDRVEEKFEKSLGKEELERFREMLKEGKVIAFKLSPKYKKAVYKTREEVEANAKMEKGKLEKGESTQEKELPRQEAVKKEQVPDENETSQAGEMENALEKNGFLVCKNQNEAKALSIRLKEQIEKGEIRGIKGFDGMFYITEDALYQKHRGKVLEAIQGEKGISSLKISEKAGIDKALAKIICELLKDEGEIIEKRKDQFQAI